MQPTSCAGFPTWRAVDPSSLAILRFHLAVGTRLALRLLVPGVAAAMGGGMLLGPDFLLSLARGLFGPQASLGRWLAIPALCLGVAGMAAPRICRGIAGGWLRHLPASGREHWRAAVLAVAVAQVPLLLGLAGLAAVAAGGPARFLVACAALTFTALAASAVAVGSIGKLVRRRPLARGWLVLPLPLRIAGRALRWRLLGASCVALLPLVVTFAFLVNNDLPPAHRQLAVRLGAAVAVVLLFAQLGEALAVLRPAWPWARSLPWSAQRRVSADAALLAGFAVAVLGGSAFLPWASPWSLLAVAALLPLLALRAAGAIRRAPESSSGASGEILGEGLFAAALVALLPWSALLGLIAAPLALRLAVERERRQKVSRWLPLHHLAAGDPQSWSAS